MTEQEIFIQYMEAFHDFSSETVKQKNKDYSGENNDPLRNFKDAANLAGVTVEQGILVRMADKIVRARNLTQRQSSNGDVGESIEDTLMDLGNYAGILSFYCKTNYPQIEEKLKEDYPEFIAKEINGDLVPPVFVENNPSSDASPKVWYEKLFNKV